MCFETLFRKSNGKPVIYQGDTLYIADYIDINKKCSGYVKLISTSSEYKQGVALYADENLLINNIKGKKMVLWEKHFNNGIAFSAESSKGYLIVNNIWDIGNGVTQSGHNGAAMKKEIIAPNHFRYYCNDGHPDANFDDIIFDVIINSNQDS